MREETAIFPVEPEPEGSLLLKYIRGRTTDAENNRIIRWLKVHPDNEKTLLQVAQIHDARRTRERILQRNPVVVFHEILKRKNRKGRMRALKRFATAAACVTLFLSVAVNFYFMRPETGMQQFVTVQTNAGMRTGLSLPDGTDVHLNSASKLTYPMVFNGKKRLVTLDGEGFFKVAHATGRPFVVKVESKPAEVEALGTGFNIQAYASDSLMKITLVEGAVRFGVRKDAGEWKHKNLNPSENAVYNDRTGSLSVGSRNPVYDIAWMKGRLMFRDTPLPEVLMRLSHFYNVVFDVEDDVINSHTFTGTFENRQLSQVLDYLSISSQIKYRITSPAEDDSRGVRRTKVILKKR